MLALYIVVASREREKVKKNVHDMCAQQRGFRKVYHINDINYPLNKIRLSLCNLQHLSKNQLTLTASKVEPMAIKLEIKRAKYHTLRGDCKFANNAGGCGRVVFVVVVVVEVANDVE